MRCLKPLFIAAVLALLSACAATGPGYNEVVAKIPPVPADKARIYFYRSNTIVGAALTSDIRLNDRVVGKSERGSFFFVDQAPGNCLVSTSTEVEKQLTFTVAAGETKYVRTSVSFGVLVGRINSELVNADEAKAEITNLNYTGTPLK